MVTVIITIISNNIPDAKPAYKGRSSSVICQDPKLRVMGGSGVEDLKYGNHKSNFSNSTYLLYASFIPNKTSMMHFLFYLITVVSVFGRLVESGIGTDEEEDEIIPLGTNEVITELDALLFADVVLLLAFLLPSGVDEDVMEIAT